MAQRTDEIFSYLTYTHKNKNRAIGVFLLLAALVSAAVFWQFKLSAITMTDDVNCGMQEHIHSAECYSVGESGEEILICEIPEHSHTVDCLSDKTADVETENEYTAGIPKCTGNKAEDIIQTALSQVGYSESKRNFVLDGDGVTRRGYTRYGEWYGNTHGAWNAMFVSFCLCYSDISENEIPYSAGAWAWTVELEEKGIYNSGNGNDILPGDIVFFDCDGDDKNDKVAIAVECGESISAVEGDFEDSVSKVTYELSCEDIVGYVRLSAEEKTEEEENGDKKTNSEDGSDSKKATEKTDADKTEKTKKKKKSAEKEALPEALLSTDSISEGTYGSGTFRYNRVTDAFVSDATYEKYHNNSDLGTAGCFHIICFDTLTLSSHCNGNILANTLEANSNFGTNGLSDELSYIVNYSRVNGTSASNASHTLVLGSEAALTTTDNGNSIAVNGTKLDKPKNVVQDIDSSTHFIDFDRVENELLSLSTTLSQQATTGVTTSFNDQNNRNITITSTDGLAFYSMDGSTLSSYANNPLRIKGFEKDKNGTLVINVNCEGCSKVNMPEATMYIGSQEQSTGETTDFSNGKILWNFYNASGCKITAKRMSGSVLAIGADITSTSNLNGSIFAENILLQGESHRNDFTGSLGQFAIGLSSSPKIEAQVQVNDTEATDEEFKFKIYALSSGGWNNTETITQSNGEISYEVDTPSATAWYCISQISDTVTGNYEYDSTEFFVSIDSDSTVTYYRLTDSAQKKEQIITGGEIDVGLLQPLGEDELPVFNNLKNPYSLPATGGIGSVGLYISGIFLLSMGYIGLLISRKKRRNQASSLDDLL